MTKFALPALVFLVFGLFYFSITSPPDAPELATPPVEQTQTVPPVDNAKQDREPRLTEAVDSIRAELKKLSDDTKANSDRIAQVVAARPDPQDSQSSNDKTAQTMAEQVDAVRSDQTKFMQTVKEANDKAAQDLRQEIASVQTRLAAQFGDTVKANTARTEALTQRVDAIKTDLDDMKKTFMEERQNASNISPGLALFVALAALVLGPFVARQLTANQIAAAKKQADDEARMSAQRAKAVENEPPLAPSAAADVKESTIHAGDAPPVGGEADHGDEGSANRHAASDPEKV